ncbi:MAG: HAD hydrolase-like protein [Deltaproteobacteria bacterium]|nr:HAD hydrolase-like protein [Deltaproteobacteria bacterium]
MTGDLPTKQVFRILESHPEIRVICFDFFDTLVYRTVEPEHTKKLAARQLGLLFNEGLDKEKIYRLRSQLEMDLCRKNEEAGNDPEFNIIDLADALYDRICRLGAGMPRWMDRKRFKKVFVDIEIRVETRVQRVFADTRKLLKACKDRGYQTVVISDFYVPNPFFKRFMDIHGLCSMVDQVLVSCDFYRTKASGRLYEKLFEPLCCKPQEVMMIGDNGHSDVRMAEEKGILAFAVDRSAQRRYYRKWSLKQQPEKERHRRVEARIAQQLKRHAGKLFPEMGVTLWRFTSLLFDRLIRDEVQDIFFLSKEGELLKALFDQYQQEQFGSVIIRSHYLLASRKSSFIGSLRPLSEEDFARLFFQYRAISPRDFLLSLNFTESEAKSLCKDLSIEYGKRIDPFGFSPEYVSILQHPEFAQRYERKRKTQRENFIRYLQSFGVDFYREGLHLVDVGWKGSIQDNIFFCLGGKVRVSGYYLGLLNPTHRTERNRKHGILFSNTPAETPYLEVYNSNRSLFEMLLSATHGSADGYFTEKDGVEQLEATEPGDFRPADGDPGIRIRLKELPRERALFTEKIQPIQQSILKVYQAINRICLAGRARPSEEWVARRHARMIYRPRKEEISFFESLYHLENFGIFEFTEFSGTEIPTLSERIRNLKQVTKDPDRVTRTGIWAPVVLKRMGLGFCTRPFGLRAYWEQFPHPVFQHLGRSLETIRSGLHRMKPKKWIRIAFFVGIPDICGGTYVILEHACRLQSMGYPVFVLTENRVDPKRYSWHPDAGKLAWLTFREAENLSFDFAVATWWMSAFFLKHVSARTYLYFIQSIETRFFPEDGQATYEERLFRRLAEKSYALPVPAIAIAGWIRKHLSESYGRQCSLVVNGIRKDLYTESGPCYAQRVPARLRVLIEGPLGVPYKNVERAIELARSSDADEVWLLTSSAVSRYPGADRIFSRIPIQDVPKVYRSCDVLLKLSTVEGMFGPPLEMFHCGGTAVVYNVTGHDEYIHNGVNSFVVEMGDEKAVVEHLNILKHHPEVLDRLKKGALQTARGWPDWEVSSKRFESALRSAYGKFRKSRSKIAKITENFWTRAESDVCHVGLQEALAVRRAEPQTCQIFWHHGDGHTEEKSKKIRYKSDRWVTLETCLMFPAGKIFLRIDPCMQIGVICIRRILVSATDGQALFQSDGADRRWKGVEISGTASVIDDTEELIVKAFDQDPQILLQPIEIHGDGDVAIRLAITFKLLSFPMTVRDLLRVRSMEDRSRPGFQPELASSSP